MDLSTGRDCCMACPRWRQRAIWTSMDSKPSSTKNGISPSEITRFVGNRWNLPLLHEWTCDQGPSKVFLTFCSTGVSVMNNFYIICKIEGSITYEQVGTWSLIKLMQPQERYMMTQEVLRRQIRKKQRSQLNMYQPNQLKSHQPLVHILLILGQLPRHKGHL